jgi:diguanylate cyclase (GGDEF)-like protein
MSTWLDDAGFAALAQGLQEPLVVVASGHQHAGHRIVWANEAAAGRLDCNRDSLFGARVALQESTDEAAPAEPVFVLAPGEWLWQSLPNRLNDQHYWWVRGFALVAEPGVRNVQSAAYLTTPAAWARVDRLTGLMSGGWFHEITDRDWALAQREVRVVTMFAFEVDGLESYVAAFGKTAGDAALRKVAFALHGGLRRPSDLLARTEGGHFPAMASGMPAEAAEKHTQVLVQRVADLAIHHPKSPSGRYLTVSAAVLTHTPTRGDRWNDFHARLLDALNEAKAHGGNRVVAL